MPLSLPVLMGFLGEVVEPSYSLESYLSFVTTLVVWMGLIFETPLLVYLVARLGLLTAKQLSAGRRVVWFWPSFSPLSSRRPRTQSRCFSSQARSSCSMSWA